MHSPLRSCFRRLLDQVRAQPAFASLRVSLEIGQASEFPAPRDYAYCQTLGPMHYRIVFAPKISKASQGRMEGLLMHELAHAMGNALGVQEHGEKNADKLAEHVFQKPIYYDDEDVQTTSKKAARKRIRPSHLHQ